MVEDFLSLLAEDAPRDAFDAAVTDALDAGVDAATLDELRKRRAKALRIRDQLDRHRRREAEMTALYETASDLTAIRDVDTILAAIVRRARQLLRADMAYLSLNDEEEGASYMKVTDGALTEGFRNIRLPLGTGLLGLVAQTGAPYYTENYQADERFVHREYIDEAVAGEQIRAILGVPLVVEGKVIGALLAVHRTVRPFPPEEVSLLVSFAAHAALALENARLFAQTQEALADLDAANRQIRAHSDAMEQAANAHDKLTDVLVQGGGVAEVAAVLADVLHGSVVVYDDVLRELAASGDRPDPCPGAADLVDAVAAARRSGRSVPVREDEPGSGYVAVASAGTEHLGTLLLAGRADALALAERRTLERGALVTALVLLFARSVAEAEERVRGELLEDLLSGDQDAHRLRERARLQRADLDGLGVVAVAAVEGGDRHRSVRVAAALARELGGLAGDHAGQVVLVVPGDDPVAVGRLLQERLGAAGGTCTLGVVRMERRGPAEVAAGYAEARRCLDALLTLGRTGEVSDPAGLGVAQLLLGRNGPGDVDAFVAGTVGPVLEYDARRGTDLLVTLDAWFAAGGRRAETARRLHVHPHTVAQRLERLDRLLGEGWREPARTLDLRLAVLLWRLQGGSTAHQNG